VDPSEQQRRAQLAEEFILTDERLRGSLTDDQFEEILRWALPLAHEAAAATAAIEERAAADAALADRLQSLRRLIREAVQRAEAGEPLPPATNATTAWPPERAAEREPPDPRPTASDAVEPSAQPSGGSPPTDERAQAADAARGFLERGVRRIDGAHDPDGC
jgi:hypothetical protein